MVSPTVLTERTRTLGFHLHAQTGRDAGAGGFYAHDATSINHEGVAAFKGIVLSTSMRVRARLFFFRLQRSGGDGLTRGPCVQYTIDFFCGCA